MERRNAANRLSDTEVDVLRFVVDVGAVAPREVVRKIYGSTRDGAMVGAVFGCLKELERRGLIRRGPATAPITPTTAGRAFLGLPAEVEER